MAWPMSMDGIVAHTSVHAQHDGVADVRWQTEDKKISSVKTRSIYYTN